MKPVGLICYQNSFHSSKEGRVVLTPNELMTESDDEVRRLTVSEITYLEMKDYTKTSPSLLKPLVLSFLITAIMISGVMMIKYPSSSVLFFASITALFGFRKYSKGNKDEVPDSVKWFRVKADGEWAGGPMDESEIESLFDEIRSLETNQQKDTDLEIETT